MIKYGHQWPDGIDDLAIELFMFREWSPAQCFDNSRFFHLHAAIKIIRPDIQWNAWLEDQLEALCGEDSAYRIGNTVFRDVVFSGCAAAGKTFSVGLYAWVWWLADMDNSAVILTSTTKPLVRRRVWPVIQDMFSQTRQTIAKKRGCAVDDVNAGHLVDSEVMIQAQRGDYKHSISAMAVRDGETQKAVANLKGQHVPRIMVVIDEAPYCPEAIFETMPNMRKACQDITVVSIGQPSSRLNPHGQLAEPVGGWEKISRNMHRWKTKGVKKWQMEPGLCLRFAGSQSPNVLQKQTILPFLYTWEDYLAATKGDQNSIAYWAEDEGWWPPDGMVCTVLTEIMLTKYRVFDKHEFKGPTAPCASLDPGFGGDDCIFRTGLIGQLESGGLGLQLTGYESVPLHDLKEHEVDYFIANFCIDRCKTLGIDPPMFGTDSTAIGRGVYSIIANEWDARIRRVEFGGAPSDMPSGQTDPRPGKDVYDNRVTELWFAVKEMVITERIKGLDEETAKQFCLREYEKPSRKYVLNKKADYKAKWGQSPDLADATVVLVEVARLAGVRPATKLAKRRETAWSQITRDAQAVYEDIDYAPVMALD